MISQTHDNYTLLIDEYDNLSRFSEILTNKLDQFKGCNLIIDLTTYKNASLDEIIQFLELSNNHRATGQSFVIVNNALPIDMIPDELMIVPTVQEAVDVIQMEDIERDLGL